MAKYDITQLEQATTVPAGSLHLVEMGDGSGTKAVTQETLINETGKALKVGDLAELQTEDKTSLVAAINEAAQSGGGGTSAEVDILDTKEEIEANTEPEKAAGALAVKDMFAELNNNLQFPDGIKFYPDVQNGVRGYNTDAARGADTFYPFSETKYDVVMTVIPENYTITIGYKPSFLAIVFIPYEGWNYCVSSIYRTDGMSVNSYLEITNTGFKIKYSSPGKPILYIVNKNK